MTAREPRETVREPCETAREADCHPAKSPAKSVQLPAKPAKLSAKPDAGGFTGTTPAITSLGGGGVVFWRSRLAATAPSPPFSF